VLTRRVARFDDAGHGTMIQGVAFNATSQHRMFTELQSASQRVALITREVGIGTWMVDMEHRGNHWDECMWHLRGLAPKAEPPDEEGMLALVHEDDRDALRERLESLSTQEGDTHYEFRVHWPDGSVHWLASRSMLIRDESQRPVRRIGLNWDVTAAHQAQEERHARELAQRESETKGELLARLSHELRTPLNAILGFTRLLLTEESAPTDAAQRISRLQQIEHAGQHLLCLINDVLELAQPGEPSRLLALQPVDLLALLHEVLPMVETPARARGIVLQLQVPPLNVMADAVRLKQVVLNLLTNAIKYNREQGRIEVRAEAWDGKVRLRVRDTGVGMTPEETRSVFDPFYRSEAHASGIEGTGIGLAIVKTLVHRMGGEIQVQSQPGQGSTFELTLTQAPERPAEPAASPRRSILYIEDNAINMMIVAELAARHAQLDFEGAESGARGIERACELQPDLILLDMQLPDAHGHEIYAQLQADPRTRGIPCIALSANAMPEEIRAALACGFADYWTKPLDFAQFESTIQSLFESPRAPRNRSSQVC
jgi:PAS domain S-box-containing protein